MRRVFVLLLIFLACGTLQASWCGAYKGDKTTASSRGKVTVKSKSVRTNLDRQLKKRAAAQKKEHAKAYRSAILGKANSPADGNC